MFTFKFVNKNELELYLDELFEILHSNMSQISPTNNSYRVDFEIWSSHIIPAMEKEQRKIVLMFVDDLLAGYFQYFINIDKNSLMMEEIQLKKESQGTGLFFKFYKWLIKQLPKDILFVEAYANKKNFKSQKILKHLGMVELGENNNGNSFYYKGLYNNLSKKYS